MMSKKLLAVAATLLKVAVVVFAVQAASAVASPRGLEVEPVLKTLNIHQTAAFAAHGAYMMSGSEADWAAYQRAVQELRADLDALRRARGEGVQRLRRAEVTARGLLAMMESEASDRRG